MTLPTAEGEALTPPYLRFWDLEQALNTLERLKATTVAESVWSRDRQLRSKRFRICRALRFLGLIDEAGRPSQLGRETITLASRKRALASCLERAYPEGLCRNLDRLTVKQIESHLEIYRLSKATQEKAICFFLHAARCAGLKLHATIKLRQTGSRRSSRLTSSQDKEPLLAESILLADPQLEAGGTLRVTLERQVPARYSERERRTIHRVVDLLSTLDTTPRPPSRESRKKTVAPDPYGARCQHPLEFDNA
jgi:hypothetical protein